MDRIDYNVAFPTSLFELKAPRGTRAIEVDHRPRSREELAVRTTPRGWKILLRALDLTREGDVLITVSEVPPGQAGPKPDRVPLRALQDERGTVYADTRHDLMRLARAAAARAMALARTPDEVRRAADPLVLNERETARPDVVLHYRRVLLALSRQREPLRTALPRPPAAHPRGPRLPAIAIFRRVDE